jgi:multidrug efflux pump subunit AcrB
MTHTQRALVLAGLALFLAAGRPLPAQPGPAVLVEASYPGANAEVVANTVATPIEQQINGAEKMVHMVSRCTADGRYTLTVTFAPGVNPDVAQVRVQNRVNLALPQLPEPVKRGGVTTRKRAPGVLLIAVLTSPGGRFDTLYLTNYATIQIKDELTRVRGVGDVRLVGAGDYRLRVWLDPLKLAARKLTAADVLEALKMQNLQAKAGKGKDQPITLQNQGRLGNPEELGDFILKVDAGGLIVKLRDVAHVELGADRPGRVRFNGRPGVALVVYPAPDGRPAPLSAALRKRLSELRARLPDDLRLQVAFDFAPDRPGPDCLLLDLTLPDAASQERVHEALEHAAAVLRGVPGVRDVLALSENPFDFSGDRPCLLVRPAAAGGERLAQAVRARLEDKVPEVAVRLRDLPAPGGIARGGYPLDLAISGPELDRVRELAEKLAGRLRRGKQLTDVWPGPDSAALPSLYVDLDRQKCQARGVKPRDVFDTLQVYLGSYYVNDFNRFGRTWQVVVQADARFRADAETIKRLKVRNAKGEMVPLAALLEVREIRAPRALDRLDGRPMVEVTANPAAGVSLARARALCESLAEEVRRELRLPAEYRLTWLRELPKAQ